MFLSIKLYLFEKIQAKEQNLMKKLSAESGESAEFAELRSFRKMWWSKLLEMGFDWLIKPLEASCWLKRPIMAFDWFDNQ